MDAVEENDGAPEDEHASRIYAAATPIDDLDDFVANNEDEDYFATNHAIAQHGKSDDNEEMLTPEEDSGNSELFFQSSDEEDNARNVIVAAPEKEDVELASSEKRLSVAQRYASHVAARPCCHLWVSLILTVAISVYGMYAGEIQHRLVIDNSGWQTRGTLISDRHSQFYLVHRNRLALRESPSLWDEIESEVQPGWESQGSVSGGHRRLQMETEESLAALSAQRQMEEGPQSEASHRDLQFNIAGCDASWYAGPAFEGRHVWGVWHTKEPAKVEEEKSVLLDHAVLIDICKAEERTQKYLEENDLCFGDCGGGCYPPLSIVTFIRFSSSEFLSTCEELADAWVLFNALQPSFRNTIMQCAQDMKEDYNPQVNRGSLPASCPPFFSPTFIDENTALQGTTRVTSSIFATHEDYSYLLNMYYNHLDHFDTGSSRVEGTYDTQFETFGNYESDIGFLRDLGKALISAVVAAVAVLIHTRSPFLTIVGFVQVLLSFPLAYSMYVFVYGLEFFPVLNFLGLFVVAALGADDVFVTVDKWKNARRDLGEGAAAVEVAQRAFPDAAVATFLTTFTTAVAFFGTALCPVAPLFCFSVFCGTLILFDYMLCVLLVFPALCIYDRNRDRRKCCCRLTACCGRKDNDSVPKNGQSTVDKSMSMIYSLVHRARYPLMGVIAVTFLWSTIRSFQLDLSTAASVRLLREKNPLEINYQQRQKLMWRVLIEESSAPVFVVWGLTPADTGDHTNPDTFTRLVRDTSFNPAAEDAQIYLRDFCDRLFENEFAKPFLSTYTCPMNMFDDWLTNNKCGGSNSLPVPEDSFHKCLYEFVRKSGEQYALGREGLDVLMVRFKGRTRFDSSYSELDREWHLLEEWMQRERDIAPASVGRFYHTSQAYWMYDTNGQLLRAAFFASVIAVLVGAAVILASSRSLVLTAFAGFSIAYILVTVMAFVGALGWTLGFLEAICIAIVIGISADFVIHFVHAYASIPGDVDRTVRCESAVVKMGPSILGAAGTTIAGGFIMFFTVISFFVLFATVLVSTILMALVASFVVFIVLADSFGPSKPSALADNALDQIRSKSDPDGGDTPRSDAY